MKYQIGNHGEIQETKGNIIITVGTVRYRISQTILGRLRINKVEDIEDKSDELNIHPQSGNEIELS